MILTQVKAYQTLWKNKEVEELVKVHFNFNLTTKQVTIVKAIAYQEVERLQY